MVKIKFKAYAVTNEINLNEIAEKCRIPKKYTWEEPLMLQGEVLESILGTKAGEEERVMVFSFGSVVFINEESSHVIRLMEYLRQTEPAIDVNSITRYSDDYELHIGESEQMGLNDQFAMVSRYELFYPELVSTIIAKSVALEKAEEQLGRILDRLESKIDRFEKGKLHVSNRELARTTSQIVRHEYNTLAYIMILDKPDITWTNSHAAEFYDRMAEFFELNDRYKIIEKKTNILSRIMSGFSSISHSIRGLFVEWVIVILIVVEVILMLADLLK